MIARHSASNRGTSSVMLSSTRKMARAPRRAGVGDVVDDALDREAVEVAAAHLDDRAEAAVERAAARGLDDVDRAAHHRVAGEHAGGAVRQPDRVRPRARHVARCGLRRKPSPVAEPEAGDRRSSGRPALERAEQLAERQVAFAADDHVDAERRIRPRVRREARIVAADDDPDVGRERANERDDPARRAPLERHHREPDDVGLELADQPFDGRSDRGLREDQIGDRDP